MVIDKDQVCRCAFGQHRLCCFKGLAQAAALLAARSLHKTVDKGLQL